MKLALRVASGLSLAAGLGLTYAGLLERNAFTLRRYVLPVLPAGAPAVKVLHLTDLHLMPNQRRKIEWVRGLAQLSPDFVVNTGDNISHQGSVQPLTNAMEPFLGLPGAFVLGSNDYWAPTPKNPARYLTKRVDHPTSARLPTQELVAGLRSGGWHDLTNRRSAATVRGLEFELVGVDDPHHHYDRYALIAGPADPRADLTIGVMHAPYTRVLDAMARDGAGLLMAGHTHGGQLAVPFYGALVTNCDLDSRRAKGVSRWWPGANGVPAREAPAGAAWMHVSAGLGTSPWAPVRFACRPEASLITLVPKNS